MNHAPLLVALLLGASSALVAAEPLIVDNGKPPAEIVIAERPARTVRLAATDLQMYVQKISGARLPIVTVPSDALPNNTRPSEKIVKLFVGRNSYTDRLGITADGLKFGDYRLVSGNDSRKEFSIALRKRDRCECTIYRLWGFE